MHYFLSLFDEEAEFVTWAIGGFRAIHFKDPFKTFNVALMSRVIFFNALCYIVICFCLLIL
jgi:hypothetical protein